jgi:hypothetical protein
MKENQLVKKAKKNQQLDFAIRKLFWQSSTTNDLLSVVRKLATTFSVTIYNIVAGEYKN